MSAVADVSIIKIFDKEGFLLVTGEVFVFAGLLLLSLGGQPVGEDVLDFGGKGGVYGRNGGFQVIVEVIILGFLFLMLDEGVPLLDDVREGGLLASDFGLLAVAAVLKTH